MNHVELGRVRKRATLLLFLAMVAHTVKTRHTPAYGFEWDGLHGYYTCNECGARLLAATISIKEPQRRKRRMHIVRSWPLTAVAVALLLLRQFGPEYMQGLITIDSAISIVVISLCAAVFCLGYDR